MAGPAPVDNRAGALPRYTFAYYCSGHGYGHATRVVALTHELLARGHAVHVCTNAPSHVFNSVIASGASYRHAEIDAGIVQPKAYDVARAQTVAGLEAFLHKRPARIAEERDWLKSIRAHAVLVDAPFLPCTAAKEAGIPSVIISNFTFDSCYSYLSVSTEAEHAPAKARSVTNGLNLQTSLDRLENVAEHAQIPNGTAAVTFLRNNDSSRDAVTEPAAKDNCDEEAEQPIPSEYLEPLVSQAIADYANASLLLRLPGAIPIPAFDLDVPLPAPRWTDLKAHSFNSDIMSLLSRDTDTIPCDGKLGLPSDLPAHATRRVKNTPLITRPISDDVYTLEARRRLLSSIGVPEHEQEIGNTRILVVSFGGQSIPKPTSRPPSRAHSPALSFSQFKISDGTKEARQSPIHPSTGSFSGYENGRSRSTGLQAQQEQHPSRNPITSPPNGRRPSAVDRSAAGQEAIAASSAESTTSAPSMQRVVTQEHIYLPGAPPALHQVDWSKVQSEQARRYASHPANHRRRVSIELHPTFSPETSPVVDTEFDVDEENLLPSGWIAIVCGLSAKDLEQDDLPAGFYAAPRDVYVPDLTATCDVLLGKLGYGTCSETVATQTPFVYVPRPLFVEEFGLKRLMEQQGTAIPMTRADFEAGRWSRLVLEAHERGKAKKDLHREHHIRQSHGLEPRQERAGLVIAKQVEHFMAAFHE